jgi:hypothetical protein
MDVYSQVNFLLRPMGALEGRNYPLDHLIRVSGVVARQSMAGKYFATIKESLDNANDWLFSWWLKDGKIPEQIMMNSDNKSWNRLVTLWVFGSELEIPLLQNHIIDLVLRMGRRLQGIPVYIVNEIFRNTGPDSPLRALIIDCLVWGGITEKDFRKTYYYSSSEDVLYTFILSLLRRFENPNMSPPPNNPRNYYVPDLRQHRFYAGERR